MSGQTITCCNVQRLCLASIVAAIILVGTLDVVYFRHIDVISESSKNFVRGCYFTNWSQYRSGLGKFVPSDYVPGLCTHILYAFLSMNEDFTVNLSWLVSRAFEWNDESTEWSKGQFEQVGELKKTDHHLKILLSLGGWNFGGRLFTAMSSTQSGRKSFISSLIPLLRKLNFDGFDLDWEYPAAPGDRARYSDLIQDIAAAFTLDSKKSGRPRLLFTAAVSAGEATMMTAYDIPTLSKHLDYVFVMTYDFHGAWEQVTGLNSPLFSRAQETDWAKSLNTNFATNYWVIHGMPKEKIVVGIASYGRGWTLNSSTGTASGIGSPTQGPSKPTEYVKTAGYASYYELCEMLKTGAVRYWQKEQQAPYLVKGDQWFGYDDEVSVRNKMRWIKREGYGGAFVWTLDFEDFRGTFCTSTKFPLISVLVDELYGPNLTQVDPEPFLMTVTSPLINSQQLTETSLHPSTSFECQKDKGHSHTCPADLWYNDVLGYCTKRSESGCFSTTTVTPSIILEKSTTTHAGHIESSSYSCNSDGFYRNPGDCTKFYRCVYGTAFNFNCPANLYFSVKIQACDYSSNVDCDVI